MKPLIEENYFEENEFEIINKSLENRISLLEKRNAIVEEQNFLLEKKILIIEDTLSKINIDALESRLDRLEARFDKTRVWMNDTITLFNKFKDDIIPLINEHEEYIQKKKRSIF